MLNLKKHQASKKSVAIFTLLQIKLSFNIQQKSVANLFQKKFQKKCSEVANLEMKLLLYTKKKCEEVGKLDCLTNSRMKIE